MTADLVGQVMALPPDVRRARLAALSQGERIAFAQLVEERRVNPYFRFRDDPVGFMTATDGLGETAWGLQRNIMESVRDHRKTAVPACHAPGKTHIASRIIAWWGSVHPAGSARVLTTATSFRQVKNILWPYLRRVHAQHQLPGRMNLVEWRIGPNLDILAEGVKPPDEDEHALSGLHAPHVLIVVDEAGGISHAFGQTLIGLLTGSHTRLLIIGNPAVDEEGSWFEQQCNDPSYNVIPIPASLTPNWTKEDAGRCKAHPEMEPHPISDHLVDHVWAADLVRQYGEGSPVVQARRDAIFPKNAEAKTVPIAWLEAALVDDTDGTDPRRRQGSIRQGVDIAGGGMDEFVIAQADGNIVTVEHRMAGAKNAEPGYMEKTIRAHAAAAAEQHRLRKNPHPVLVKVDTVGVGFGIFNGLLAKQADPRTRLEGVEFVEVSAGANARDHDHFRRQRDEGWWTLREAVQHDAAGRQAIVLDLGLDVEKRNAVLKQLNAPRYTQDTSGKTVVESKDSMKDRGVSSPDVADAVWMALYEPEPVETHAPAGGIEVGGPGDTFARFGTRLPGGPSEAAGADFAFDFG